MIDELKNLGLDHYEAKALSHLFNSKLTLRELSDKAGIPFGKVYSVVKALRERGIVLENNSRPKLIYVDNVSEVVSRLIEEKQKKEEESFSKLREIAIKTDKLKKNRSKFLEIGIENEERKEIQLRIFREAEKEVLQIFNMHHNPGLNRKRKVLYEKEIEENIERGVNFRTIYPREADLPESLTKLNRKFPSKFRVKRFNTDFVRCDIVDETKVLIKLTQKDVLASGGVIFIEDERFAQNLKDIFDALWEQ